MLSLICVWINGWVNNREAGDLRRHRCHYDVIVMDRYVHPICIKHESIQRKTQNFYSHRVCQMHIINTLRPRQHGRHFADDTFKRIFLNENVGISIKISLKFVHKGPINNIPTLVQIMAWRRPGDKPLSEPMVGSLLTHICVTQPQWVNWTIIGLHICIHIKYVYIKMMAMTQKWMSIAVTSYERYVVSNHRQIDRFFTCLFKITTQDTPKLDLCAGKFSNNTKLNLLGEWEIS